MITIQTITKNELERQDSGFLRTSINSLQDVFLTQTVTDEVENYFYDKFHADDVTIANFAFTEIDSSESPLSLLAKKRRWADKEYRHGYAEAAVEQGLAWQIRVNRELRGLSQSELAKMIGSQQSSISRLEDPTYGGHSLPMLMRLAEVFDCSLIVRFASFSALARESECLDEAHLYAKSYVEEMKEIKDGN